MLSAAAPRTPHGPTIHSRAISVQLKSVYRVQYNLGNDSQSVGSKLDTTTTPLNIYLAKTEFVE
jgi:hypothetical protein